MRPPVLLAAGFGLFFVLNCAKLELPLPFDLESGRLLAVAAPTPNVMERWRAGVMTAPAAPAQSLPTVDQPEWSAYGIFDTAPSVNDR